VAGSCEYGDEPLCSGATDLVIYFTTNKVVTENHTTNAQYKCSI
jgi:hypothetical protein